MSYKSKVPIFNAPAGTVFYYIANSYELNVCDICGKKRKCDWFECEDIGILTGFDCCRSCRSEVLEGNE